VHSERLNAVPLGTLRVATVTGEVTACTTAQRGSWFTSEQLTDTMEIADHTPNYRRCLRKVEVLFISYFLVYVHERTKKTNKLGYIAPKSYVQIQ
jgi:hypothetical protein